MANKLSSKPLLADEKPIRGPVRQRRDPSQPNLLLDPMPYRVEHPLALLNAKPPRDQRYPAEVKIDGYRLAVHIEPTGVRIITRGGHDWTERLPPWRLPLGEASGGHGRELRSDESATRPPTCGSGVSRVADGHFRFAAQSSSKVYSVVGSMRKRVLLQACRPNRKACNASYAAELPASISAHFCKMNAG
jgi:hypothetical protein